MLCVRKPLYTANQVMQKIRPELRPFASAEIAVRKNHGSIKIALEGVILGDGANELGDFLRDVSSFRASVWTLRMEKLYVISTRGLRQLVRLARRLRGRGCGLVIQSIHGNVYTTLQELKLLREFEWPERAGQKIICPPGRNFSNARYSFQREERFFENDKEKK